MAMKTFSPNSKFSDEFLQKIPKTDLHCHLDGSIRLSTLIDLAKEQNIDLPYHDEELLKQNIFKETYNNLEEYLSCFQYTCAVLRTAEALERVAYELAIDQYSIGVKYFEVRFAPQLNAIPGKLSIEDVLRNVHNGLKRATEESNSKITNALEPDFDYGIIVCGMRFFAANFSPYYKHFMEVHPHEDLHRVYGLASMALITTAHHLIETEKLPIVALDIAGAENGFPASNHKDAYDFAYKKYIHRTVHAGEGYGPESIHQAITDCHAERIGHGFHLLHSEEINHNFIPTKEGREKYVNDLVEYVSDTRTSLEVCITSNLQTIPSLEFDASRHPLKDMLNTKKVSVSLCSDNCTVSCTDVLKEARLAVDAFDLSPADLKKITIAGFKRSFQSRPYVEKREYNHAIIKYYEDLEKKYNIVA